jgi:hypothetical protein
VNMFMNKFRRLGFIEYSGQRRGIKVNSSLISVVLHHWGDGGVRSGALAARAPRDPFHWAQFSAGH